MVTASRLHCACCARDSWKPIRVKNRKSQQAKFQRHHLPQSSVKTSQARTQAIKVSADQFEGKRSLATTRMFLFDLCERMFACRNPDMAERCREALRNAKDRETMLAASREMIEEIEKVAGHGRADSISERIAMLLPADSGANLAA